MKIFYISKQEDQRICAAIVMRATPPGHAPIRDSQQQWITIPQLQNAARDWTALHFEDGFEADINHDESEGNFHCFILESYVVEEEEGIQKFNTIIPWGAWFLTIVVDSPEMWKMIKENRLTGFSPAGTASVRRDQ